jgi:O-antigen ligase
VINTSLVVFGLCLASFLLAVWLYDADAGSSVDGVYQLFRLAQFTVVAIATASMNLSHRQNALISRVALLTFVLISIGVLLVASGLVDTSRVTPLLPGSPQIAGPWAPYARGMGRSMGAGFIGFNHGYVGMQLVLSGGAAYLMFANSRGIRLLICTLLITSTFATGSRGGFIAASAWILLCESKQQKRILLLLISISVLCGAWIANTSGLDDFINRQSSSATSMSDDGLSGRTEIWREHIEYFESHPLNIVIGTGFGFATKANENNAHMLYLHILTETGVIGLILYLYLQIKTIVLLGGGRFRAFRLTVYVLLFAGLIQETLYPVVAFNQFLGYYLSTLVLVLRTSVPEVQFAHQGRDFSRPTTLSPEGSLETA